MIRMLADPACVDGSARMAIVLVEQYYDFAAELADQYLVMERGEIVQRGRGARHGGRRRAPADVDLTTSRASQCQPRDPIRRLAMITVHHLNNSRSQRVLWLLEELGVPYEIEQVPARREDDAGAARAAARCIRSASRR